MQNTTESPGLICDAWVPEALYAQRSDTGSLASLHHPGESSRAVGSSA